MEDFQSVISNTHKKSTGLTLTGKILIGVSGATAIAISIVTFPFVSPGFRKICLPYVPATPKQIENVLKFLPQGRGKKLLDIGSGDGRICIEVARKKGFESHGVELNPWLVWYSKIAAFKSNVSSHTKFFKRDLWKFSTEPYDCIVIFGVEQMMPQLEDKLGQELHRNAQVVACRFPFPNEKLELVDRIEEGVDSVWLYRPRK